MDVLVIEDHGLVREGLCLLLEGMGLFQRCFEASDVRQAKELLTQHRDSIGLAILDLGLPDANELDALDAVLAIHPRCRVVICSAEHEPARIRDCFARGALGYLTKNSSGPALRSALESVLRGERRVPPEILQDVVSPAVKSVPQNTLTPRQTSVLRLVAKGLANKEIAVELEMSPATVRAHLSSIFRVLGVENRTQAATHPQALAALEA